MSTFLMRQGDRLPVPRIALADGDGAPVEGLTATMRLQDAATGEVIYDGPPDENLAVPQPAWSTICDRASDFLMDVTVHHPSGAVTTDPKAASHRITFVP